MDELLKMVMEDDGDFDDCQDDLQVLLEIFNLVKEGLYLGIIESEDKTAYNFLPSLRKLA